MHIVYALEEAPESYAKSIFLVGPTPRRKDVLSWRSEALRILAEDGYDGVVFVPETSDGEWKHEYDGQVEWEEDGLNRADVILCWVPRDLETMPAFTTNVEFGRWYESGKCVLGYPKAAPKMGYFAHYAKKHGIPTSHNLRDTIRQALARIGAGAERKGGETFIPLDVWKTQSFQGWYRRTIKKAGNRLDDARVRWTYRTGPDKKYTFLWIVHVKVWVEKERRHKSNEFVLGRTDISAVVLYYPGDSLIDTHVILVREFRSTVSNDQGFVLELPGGSSFKPGQDPRVVMKDECFEETGMNIDSARFRIVSERQLVATLSAHHALVGAVRLTREELEKAMLDAGKVHGNLADSEMTYVEVRTVRELLESDQMDWSNLGMIFSALNSRS